MAKLGTPKRQIHIGVLGIKGLPSKGGAERVAEEIITSALAAGFKVTVYGKNDYNNKDNTLGNVNLINIKYLPGKHLGAFSYGLISAFHALIFGNYDLIHLHCADYGYIVPLLRIKYKVIGTSHGAEYNRDKWNIIAKAFFKFSEILFVKYTNVCTNVSKSLTYYYQTKYKRKVIYIPNGINLNHNYKFGLLDLTQFKLPSKYILFAAGRIIPSKGCDILLKAYANINNKIPLVIIGRFDDKDYKKYIHQIADRNVLFIDFISDKAVLYEIISRCQFFIFPSTYEAMSIMLLEVAYLMKGIICSDICQNIDAIEDNALYFRSNNIIDLKSKIEYALEHQDKMDKIGLIAHEWIKKYRNWSMIVNNYLRIYNNVG
jgi:glycosyltransferase involved in cell wall biosynthesis